MVGTHTMEDILMEAAKSRRLDKLARHGAAEASRGMLAAR
jgi:hypothetical protein